MDGRWNSGTSATSSPVAKEGHFGRVRSNGTSSSLRSASQFARWSRTRHAIGKAHQPDGFTLNEAERYSGWRHQNETIRQAARAKEVVRKARARGSR